MPISPAQIQAAKTVQDAAAHDNSQQIRLVAGPGTGKSFSIEERVCWLLNSGIPPAGIVAVSFTRASASDLRQRIRSCCLERNQAGGEDVRVSTLHSLALRLLRVAGLLQYPANPLVLDDFELESIFDAEFRIEEGIGKRRSEEIRREHEAFWSTGQWTPPNYIPADPPINPQERNAFVAFHGPRTQTYSCVLPGEMVRQCLNQIRAGNLDPVGLIHVQQLIVDEYQDLNPIDIEFVDEFIARNVVTFVAGDDDQSIYSFRYASPAGIQDFPQKNQGSASHTLSDCFRCATSVVNTANALIVSYPSPNRIPKALNSLYGGVVPPVTGVVHRWRFTTAQAEAAAIAASCRALIDEALNPSDILILLSNQRELLPPLRQALANVNVDFDPPRAEGFRDTEPGRLILAILRIVCDNEDYVAHRLVLGLRNGVGVGTCGAIARSVIQNALNYRDIFYNPLPANVFQGRSQTALTNARATCAQIAGWQKTDSLNQHAADMSQIIASSFSAVEANFWNGYVANLPPSITLEELRDWLWADNDEQQATVLAAVYQRLNQPIPQAAMIVPCVRIMSMHGAKGLSARVVFIPGLEDDLFPGPWRQAYPGLVLEAARLLYVSVTRARAACVMSYSGRRNVQGRSLRMPASRFTTSLGGGFGGRAVGLTQAEAQAILNQIAQL
jgi:DNA helicase II / ATP-dependent DNA helicase PcrA